MPTGSPSLPTGSPRFGRSLPPHSGTRCRRSRAQAASATIRERLLTLLSEPPLAGWFSPAQGDPDTRPTAFERSIVEAERRGDHVSCLQLSLRALAASTSGDFPRRLWQAAAFADWIEREHRPIDGRVSLACSTSATDFPQGTSSTSRANSSGPSAAGGPATARANKRRSGRLRPCPTCPHAISNPPAGCSGRAWRPAAISRGH